VNTAVLPPGRTASTASSNSTSRHIGAVFGAALLGAVAWSGVPGLLALSCLAPFVIVSASSRGKVALRAGAYFLGATWPIVPAAAVFFGEESVGSGSVVLGVAFWLLVSALNVLPWVLVAPMRARGRAIGVVIGLALAAMPPLALVGLASPLAGLGWWLPGTGGWGIALYAVAGVLFVTCDRVSMLRGVLAFSALAVLGSYGVLAKPPHTTNIWQAVSTPASIGTGERAAQAMEQLRRSASTSTARVVVLPETLFNQWTASNEAFLRPLWRELAARNQVVLFGVQRLDSATGLIDNLVLIRGRESGEYAQHLPVPISMYRLGEAGSVPVRWRGPYTATIFGERVGLLICWEQLLVAPMLFLALESPDRLVGLSNLYFARGTPVAAIQEAALQSWARLYGVPWIHAVYE